MDCLSVDMHEWDYRHCYDTNKKFKKKSKLSPDNSKTVYSHPLEDWITSEASLQSLIILEYPFVRLPIAAYISAD